MSPRDNRAANRRKLQDTLRELFQFDHADLDFGIYRIMNQKRKEIERFIERDLLDAVSEGLSQFQSEERGQLEARLEQKRQALGDEALDEGGAVRSEFQRLPIAREYTALRERLRELELAEETEAHVFNDLWRFFSRYYDEGDFLPERRYSSREPKFAVPYNGEEVLLHWANRDQYYVKTSEYFVDYRFMADGYSVWFRLHRADVPPDNVKGEKRYFVLRSDDALAYDPDEQTLTVWLEYRPLEADEERRFLDAYNAQQPASSRRKSIDRGVVCMVLERDLLGAVEPTGLRDALARPCSAQEGQSLLGRHLNRYTARNTMDYFIHKDLSGFLRRELDFFLKNEVLRLDDVMADPSGKALQAALTRMRVVRRIGERIIAFLAQIEDLQKRLFEKKKFVVQVDYCLTLDRVPQSLYPKILENGAQTDEWRRLYRMDAWEQGLFWTGKIDLPFLAAHPYLMIDTAFFDDDFKARLLASFTDLDAATDGLLVHGENFQALNLLLERYRQQVKCTYIDPPYNTGNDEFLYKDGYKHSSWLTMVADRASIAHRVSRQDGVLFVSVDDNEVHRLHGLLSRVYGEGNWAALLIARTNPRGRTLDRYVAKTHEYITSFVKEPLVTSISQIPKEDRMILQYNRQDERGRYRELELRNRNPVFSRANRPNLFFPVYVNPETGAVSLQRSSTFSVEVYPKNSRGEDDCWTWGPEKVARHLRLLVGRQVANGNWRVFRKDYLLDESGNAATTMAKSVWLDSEMNHERGKEVLRDIIGFHTVDFPKSVGLVKRCLQIGATEDSLVLDYFAGSGTTAHAVMQLNREDGGKRKYILVEMAEYFDTVLKPRIQKVAFSAKWKDGVPQDHDGQSHMFKYIRLESYDDALNNIAFRPLDEPQRSLLYDTFDDYMLHYMLEVETRDSPTLLRPEAFVHPFDYTLKIQRGHQTPHDTPVDLVETFHYLLGMHVRRLERHEHQGRRYVVSCGEVRDERAVEQVVVVWRDAEGLDLEQEADWANETLLTEPVDRVYVNGPSLIRHAEPLEITFRERMFGGLDGR